MSKSPSSNSKFYVIKRNGSKEPILFDKITKRIERLCAMEPSLPVEIEPVVIAQKVVKGIYPGVKTTELDNLAAEIAAYLSTIHPDYATLAARIAISNLQKETCSDFLTVMQKALNYCNPKTQQLSPLISEELYEIVKENAEKLQKAIKYERDFNYDFFGFKTLEKGYLLKLNGKIIERPQHMLMRVALGIHSFDLESAIETYNLMSNKYFTHATPTLFNAGTMTPQMSSCFLLTMKEDSIDGIYDTLKRCALISKSAGGIGLNIHCIRASNSYISGTNGTSNGIVPMLKVFNDTARYVDQGGGKRKGAFAIYLEPWHFDIFDYLDLKKNTGKEENRAKDIFYALWIPDLFMKRVENNENWTLFCPNEAKNLHETWGEGFERLYEKYETEGKGRKTIKAQDLWFAILKSQIETGTPYMLYKDACNRKSNQQNLGTIKGSNLCTEIIQYSSEDEVAVCNLASIGLPKFVMGNKFDHLKLFEIAKIITKNLNKIIDKNYYPIKEAKKSNTKHRPIGIGIQGLADVFIKLRLPFDCKGAAELNRDIFETIYFAALTASNEIAKVDGPYESYHGSPVSKGILQYDMWGIQPSNRWDWKSLKKEIEKYGIRNSLLVALMPTASTSQILGFNECHEPYTSNIYTRRVLAGEFTIVNRQLVEDLMKLNLWTPELKNEIVFRHGSIQGIPSIPKDLQSLYKTVWEISQKVLIDMSADRGAFIDQSQSFNVFIAKPDFAKLTSMHFYGWRKGLKTGMYYLRTRPAVDAIQFTVDATTLLKNELIIDDSVTIKTLEKNKINKDEPECRMEESCLFCSS